VPFSAQIQIIYSPTCCYVRCKYLHGYLKNGDTSENSEVRWVPAKEVPEYLTTDLFPEVADVLNSIAELEAEALVVVGVVDCNSRVLMVRRTKSDSGVRWSFPGGGVEKGETPAEAVVREIFEETGVRCEIKKSLGRRSHPATGELIEYFACSYFDGEAKPRERSVLDKMAWIALSDVKKYVSSDLFPPLVRYLSDLTELEN
jgi:mutator protein MutT